MIDGINVIELNGRAGFSSPARLRKSTSFANIAIYRTCFGQFLKENFGLSG